MAGDDRVGGQVVFRSSRQVTVRVGAEDWVCELRGLLRQRGNNAVVVGDLVEVTPDGPLRGRVDNVLPRRTWLSRRREVGGGREIILAANIDRALPVFSARRPRLKFGALDRLLVAAEAQQLPATIVLNKVDLGLSQEIAERIEVYRGMGYAVLRTSVETGEGLQEIGRVLERTTTVVAGPSGVGKSSLLSKILGRPLRIGEISPSTEKGRHTTTAVRWFPVEGGGAVVDTPGFREYGLWRLAPADLASHMPDLRPFVPMCRFRDCLHVQGAGCAVRDAVSEKAITEFRYKSYVAMVESLSRPERRS